MYSSELLTKNIRRELKKQSLSQKALLDECGLGINTLSKLSNGTDILVKNLVKIADVLNCSTDYLLGRNKEFYLHPEELTLIEHFRGISLDGQKEILMLLDMKTQNQKKGMGGKFDNSAQDKLA